MTCTGDVRVPVHSFSPSVCVSIGIGEYSPAIPVEEPHSELGGDAA